MMRNKGKLVVGLALAAFATVSLASCSWWNREPEDRIILSGNIELTEVNVAFKSAGEVVELPVEEGAPVKQGMILARLDADQLEQQRAREHASVNVAESQLAQQRTAIEFQRATLEAEIQTRRASLRQAEARLSELLAGAREQEIAQARAAVEEARTQHRLAAEDWERAQVLYKNDDISTSQRDQFKARFDATAATLKRAEEQLSLVQAGARKEVIEAARAQVEQARGVLQLAEASRIELKRKEQELVTRRAQIEQARAQAALVDSQLADSVIYSPIDGVVLVKSAEPGEVVAPGTPLLTLGEVSKPWVRGYIREQDLGRVKLGAKAKVTTDSYPGKIYWGRVSFVASEAEFTPKQIQTPEERIKLMYRVKIEIENPQHELKLNMPADAEILLDSKSSTE
jgi:HlyD family secretion protein